MNRRLNIYISSSWKNREAIRDLAVQLTQNGHEVYDFTDPNCRKTPEIPPEKFPEQFDPAMHIYSQYIQRPEWKAAINENREAISRADLIILLLPCGNDAHADWGFGVGMGKHSIVVGHPHKGDRSLVHMWADAILESPDDAVEYIKQHFSTKPL